MPEESRLVDMSSRICWHCHQTAHMTRTADAYRAVGGNHPWVVFCECDNCEYPNIALLPRDAEAGGSFLDVHSLFARNDNSVVIEWLPNEPLGKEFEDVPKHIADAASEAYACFSIRSYRASILMARSVLEATAKDNGVTTGTLAAKIDKLAEQDVISDQIKDEAHEIRYLGNDMAHGDFTEPVDEEDADDMLGFLETFLDYVYQMPAAIRRRQEARMKRHANAKG